MIFDFSEKNFANGLEWLTKTTRVRTASEVDTIFAVKGLLTFNCKFYHIVEKKLNFVKITAV